MQATFSQNNLMANMPDPRRCASQSVLVDGIVTASELAETLHVSTGFVYKMARENRIPVIRMGRTVRFSVGDVERELAKYSRWR